MEISIPVPMHSLRDYQNQIWNLLKPAHRKKKNLEKWDPKQSAAKAGNF
jgi:hypothetical protein